METSLEVLDVFLLHGDIFIQLHRQLYFCDKRQRPQMKHETQSARHTGHAYLLGILQMMLLLQLTDDFL